MAHSHQFILPERREPKPLGLRVATAFGLAVTGAALTFFLVLFAAIIALVVAGLVRGAAPDMRLAYRGIALPAAIIAVPVVFAVSLWRQGRARDVGHEAPHLVFCLLRDLTQGAEGRRNEANLFGPLDKTVEVAGRPAE